MTATKKKLGAALGALALMIGAIPATVGTASAYENPKGGQHFDYGRPGSIAIFAAVLAALAVAFFAVKANDKPASP